MAWVHKTSLTPPLVNGMTVPNQEKRIVMYLCVVSIDVAVRRYWLIVYCIGHIHLPYTFEIIPVKLN